MEYDPILYNSDPRPFLIDEVEFYKNICRKFKPKKILELGVGTGRIFTKLLPLVNYGVGLDISKTMLEVCEKNCHTFKNYRLQQENFVEFNLGEVFDLIYLPFNTFQHLLSQDDQISCLKTIKQHMDQDSRFILDLMNPENLALDFGIWKRDYITTLPNGVTIERSQKNLSMDEKTSVLSKIFSYKESLENQTKSEREFPALMKITSNEKIRGLLDLAGFSIEDIWSDYFFGHNKDSKKIIYCLKVK